MWKGLIINDLGTVSSSELYLRFRELLIIISFPLFEVISHLQFSPRCLESLSLSLPLFGDLCLFEVLLIDYVSVLQDGMLQHLKTPGICVRISQSEKQGFR